MNIRAIKGGTQSNGVLGPRGYVLHEYLDKKGQSASFKISRSHIYDFTFIFGFRGVGNHFRIDFRSTRNQFTLYQIRDGIPIYLQHAYLVSELAKPLMIKVDDISIRIYQDTLCFINVWHEGSTDGYWGFAGVGQETPALNVVVTCNQPDPFEWIILGDGYSNNRWKNRDFYSWPELAFGDKANYLNACVAAGNTRRVREITHRIGAEFGDSKVILAVGADDFMERETLEDAISRSTEIATLARSHGATEIHICSILPKPKYDGGITAWNDAISELAHRHFDSLIDFHQLIASSADELLVHGDYPGAQAQRAMAAAVITHFHLPGDLARLECPSFKPVLSGMPARIAMRLSGAIDQSLGRF